jgi:hypothetical protein
MGVFMKVWAWNRRFSGTMEDILLVILRLLPCASSILPGNRDIRQLQKPLGRATIFSVRPDKAPRPSHSCIPNGDPL